MAHLAHPYEGECVAVIRKHPNVFVDCAALHYRPLQLYHSLMLVQEYGVWEKVLFGTDYPYYNGFGKHQRHSQSKSYVGWDFSAALERGYD